jgi:DNA invertase Pin-like site-specific DNA recombinase
LEHGPRPGFLCVPDTVDPRGPKEKNDRRHLRPQVHEGGPRRIVALQETRCRELAADRGWAVDARYVFRDDGISGADFDRAGLNALRDALTKRPLPV